MKNKIIQLLKENNYSQKFLDNIITNTIFKDNKNFDINILIIYHYISENKIIPENLLKTIWFLFEHFDYLKFENIQIANIFSDIEYKNIFLSIQVQKYISNLDSDKFSKDIKIKLTLFFIENYHKDIFTSDFKNFIKNLYTNNKEIIFDFVHKSNYYFKEYMLFYILDFDFWQYFEDIEKFWFLNTNLSEIWTYKNEIWEIEKNIEKFFEGLNFINFELFQKVILNFYYQNFDLKYELFQKLSDEKIFFSSVIFDKKFFNSSKNNNFIKFIADDYEFKKYKSKNILEFLAKNEIDILTEWNISDIEKFLKKIDNFEFRRYLEKLNYNENFYKKYLQISQKSPKEFKAEISRFLVKNLMKNLNLSKILYWYENWLFENLDIEMGMKFSDFFEKYNFKRESYKNIIEFIVFFIKNFQRYSFEKTSKNMIKQNWKVKYCLIKWMKKAKIDINDWEYKEIREKTYFSTHFPIVIYHFFRRIFE